MFCPDWFPFSAGLAQSCYELCKEFQKHGHKVKVVVAKDKNLDKKDLDVIELLYIARILGRNPLVFNLFEKVKKEIEWCDVVCLFSYMFEINSRIVRLARFILLRNKYPRNLTEFPPKENKNSYYLELIKITPLKWELI